MVLVHMENAGFCDGVRHAVNMTEKLHELILSGQKVYLYGALVNNAHVMQRLLNRGFDYIDPKNPEDIRKIPEGAIVVIRTHGVSRRVMDELAARGADIRDYTCGRVKSIHKIVKEKSAKGYTVVVVGKREHPEVVGIAGWCAKPAYIVSSEEALDDIDLSGLICVVAQTTCDAALFASVSGRILLNNPRAEIHNTLCGVIGEREETTRSIAVAADAMFVIGDSESANAARLYNQCREVNPNTFPITALYNDSKTPAKPPFAESLIELERKGELDNLLQSGASIGLTAGASTPDDIIGEVRDYLQFQEFFGSARREVDDACRAYLEAFKDQAPDNELVRSSLRDLCLQNEGGKRIRGAMVKLGERIAAKDDTENYLPIAVGYEVFQTSVLIHDDIIDKSDSRRNKATIHVQSKGKIKNRSDLSSAKAEHYGISRALCIGDYGFFISYLLLSECRLDNAAMARVYRLFSRILATTCEGELMDTLLPFEGGAKTDDYEEYAKTVAKIYEYKTAWYTLAGPVMLGAIAGGADDKLIEQLKNIMIPLGVAFQIQDDLLGLYASEDVLGKPVLSDVRENKQTMMYGFAYKHANRRQKAMLDIHYGKENADERDLGVVRTIFEEVGAKEYALREIRRLSDQSRALIDEAMIDESYRSILRGLVHYLIIREY